jgi:hypothetical protein
LREKLWILFLFPFSGIIRGVHHLIHFRNLSSVFGQHYQNRRLSCLASDYQTLRSLRIGRIVELTARYTPWTSSCLVQVTMARILLGFYGIPYVLHIGASKPQTGKNLFKAHAWIKVGPCVIVGGGGEQAFAVVGTWVPPTWVISGEH